MRHTFKWILTLAVFFSFHIQAQETAESNIWTAASAGDLALIKKLVEEEGVGVDAQEPTMGATALTIATITGQEEAVKLLLELGADVNNPGMTGNTALHAATFVGVAGVVEILLKAGADVTQANYEGAAPAANLELDWPTTVYIASMLQLTLVEADVMAGREKIRGMIDQAMLVRAKDDIWIAVVMNQPDLVEKHIEDGANVDQAAEDGTNLITAALAGNSVTVLKMLIDAGADVDATNITTGVTALQAAAFLGNFEAAKLLLDAGADVSIADYQGSTVRDIIAMDWMTTEYIASMIGVTLDQDQVMTARQKISEMLPAAPATE